MLQSDPDFIVFAKGGRDRGQPRHRRCQGEAAKVAMVSDPNQGQPQRALDPLAAADQPG
jgi:hypothetical protein